MKAIRLLLVDDHRIVRQGIRSILDSDHHFVIVGEAANGASALRAVAELMPDVVLLDIKLPDMDGIEVCRRVHQMRPQTAVLVLSAFIDQNLVNACLQAGARGYLLKDAENLRLKEQLSAVMQGYAALDPRAAGMLTNLVQNPAGKALAPRDLTVLRFIAQGLSNREISARLCLSEHTVKGYVKDILAKLGVHSRVEAVLYAKDRGMI